MIVTASETVLQVRTRSIQERVRDRYSAALCRTHWAGTPGMHVQYIARARWMDAWQQLGEQLYEAAARDTKAEEDQAYSADLCQPRHTTLADDQEPDGAALRRGDEMVHAVAARAGSSV